MNLVKKATSIIMAALLTCSLSATAFADKAEKQIPIYGSEDEYVSVDNVNSEKTFGDIPAFCISTVYYATAPVKVSFMGSEIGAEEIDYLPDAVIGTDGVTFDDQKAEELTFDVKNYTYCFEPKGVIYNELTTPRGENDPVYITGNYATITKPGVYYVCGAYAVMAGAPFILSVSDGASNVCKFAATPTASSVLVNGSQKSFDAYNINSNNYFKLRDIAYVLSGSAKQFEVSWDGANKAINLMSGKAYTPVGGEMATGSNKSVEASATTSTVYIDGKQVPLAAYTINGNNYFKLRDIGQAFNFGVTWDGATNTVGIDTSTGYSA